MEIVYTEKAKADIAYWKNRVINKFKNALRI